MPKAFVKIIMDYRDYDVLIEGNTDNVPINLKKKYGLSVLVLAHTPKRSLDCPITQNVHLGTASL